MSLIVPANYLTSTTKFIEHSKKLQKPTTSVSLPQKEEDTVKNQAKTDLIVKILERLDLEDNFLQVSIIERDGKPYVKITRPLNDKLRTEERDEFSLGAIRAKLGLNQGVLMENNDLRIVTGRPNLTKIDRATIECDQSLIIPLSELGQKRRLFGKDELTDMANNYINSKK